MASLFTDLVDQKQQNQTNGFVERDEGMKECMWDWESKSKERQDTQGETNPDQQTNTTMSRMSALAQTPPPAQAPRLPRVHPNEEYA